MHQPTVYMEYNHYWNFQIKGQGHFNFVFMNCLTLCADLSELCLCISVQEEADVIPDYKNTFLVEIDQRRHLWTHDQWCDLMIKQQLQLQCSKQLTGRQVYHNKQLPWAYTMSNIDYYLFFPSLTVSLMFIGSMYM